MNKSMTLNNEISKKTDMLKEMESMKNALAAENEENACKKTAQMTEEGQIIMTINSIYIKLSRHVVEPLQISMGSGKDSKEDDKPVPADNFDHQERSERNAKMQLEFIRDKLEALGELTKVVGPIVAKPLKLKLCAGNEKSVDFEIIKKFLVEEKQKKEK